MTLRLLLVSIFVLFLNVPFGYWRGNVRKMSFQWVLAIHIPVPLVIVLRLWSDIGFAWYTYIFLVAAFFTGQYLGVKLLKHWKNKGLETSSCLLMDLIHRKQ